MYWEIGRIVSEKTASGGWGKSTVSALASYLQSNMPASTGFSERNIWRMKQFYETYKDNEKLSPLVAEIPWTNNLLIMTACKTDEAKEFYLRACIENHYSKRELERQIDSMLYERTAISDAKYGALAKKNEGLSGLRDAYVLEFLKLPASYKDLFGEEYRLQVGNTDFFVNLLFFNRTLSCLVAIELRIGMFRPEHLGQLNLYLEALDRDVRKPNENPSVGLVICTGKDGTVLEYTLSRRPEASDEHTIATSAYL